MARLGTHASQPADAPGTGPDTDHSRLSLDDLHALQERVAREITARRTAGREQAIARIRALADGAGLSVTIHEGRRGKKGPSGAAAG